MVGQVVPGVCPLESSVHLSPVSKARVGLVEVALQFMVEVAGVRQRKHRVSQGQIQGEQLGTEAGKGVSCQQPEL